MKLTDPETRGRSIAILLLIIPVLAISWGFYEKVKMPLNQLEFFKYTLFWSFVTYSPVWLLAYLGKKWVPTTLFITAITFFMWFLGFLLTAATVNRRFDSSEAQTYYRLIVRKHQSLGSSGKNRSAPSCTVWFHRPIHFSEYGPLKYDECDLANVNQDGVLYKLRSGKLGFLWVEDHSVVKDYQSYMQRLQLSEDPL